MTFVFAPQLQEMAEQLKGAIDNSYDTLIASKAAGGKRKRDPEAAEKANAKKEEAANATASIDWRAELEANTLKKRTVPQLKAYCDTNGLSTKGKKVSLSLSLYLSLSISLSLSLSLCVRACVRACVRVIHKLAPQRSVLSAWARTEP